MAVLREVVAAGWMARKGCLEKRSEVRGGHRAGSLGKGITGRGSSKCKGPEVRMFSGPGAVSQVCNSSYLEAKIGKIAVRGRFRQKVHETLSQPMAGCSGTCYHHVQLCGEAQTGSQSRPA
jgi:hypothetical protein